MTREEAQTLKNQVGMSLPDGYMCSSIYDENGEKIPVGQLSETTKAWFLIKTTDGYAIQGIHSSRNWEELRNFAFNLAMKAQEEIEEASLRAQAELERKYGRL